MIQKKVRVKKILAIELIVSVPIYIVFIITNGLGILISRLDKILS